MKRLLAALKIPYKTLELYETALTHGSYAHENHVEKNERLEFLGDAVLELLMSDYFYHLGFFEEGEMTKKRAQAVCEEALVIYAKKIKLDLYLRVGRGELANGPKDSMIADSFEAFLGAVYLDLGFQYTQELFDKIVKPHLDKVRDIKDYKSTLQEYIQGGDKRNLSYHMISENGPSHNKRFVCVVKLDNHIALGTGEGKTKKEAEQMAAKNALEKGNGHDKALV